MASDVIGKAFVRIDPDTSNFGGSLESGISGSLKRIGGLVAAAFAVDKIKDAGLAAVSVAADFQQVKIAFEGVLGSAEAANAFIGKLQKFAASTPFEFPELARASQQLLGVGFSAEQVIPTLSDLGNVAATLGVGSEGINNVVRALGQIKGKGKTSAEELQQISESLPGFSAVAAIAAAKGETVAQTFDRLQKGTVSADEGIDAIIKGMRNFKGASGAMERQSKTLNGVISTFKDNLRLVAIDFITPKLPAITKAVERFGDVVKQGFEGNLKGAAVSLGKLFGQEEDSAFTDALIRIGDAMKDLAPVAADLATKGLDVVATALGAAVIAFSGFAEAVAAVVTAFTDPKKALDEFGVAGTAAALVAGTLLTAFLALKGANAAATAIDGVVTSVQNFGSVGSKLGEVAKSQVSGITGLIDNFKNYKQAQEAATKASAEAADKIKDLKKSYEGLENAALQTTLAGDKEATEALKKEMENLDKQLKDMGSHPYKVEVEEDKNATGRVGSSIAGGIAGGIAGALGPGLKSALAGAAGAIGTAIATIGLAPVLIGVAIAGAGAAVAAFVLHFRRGILHFLLDTWPRFITEQVPNAFKTMAGAVAKAVSAAFRGAKSGVGDVKDFLFDKGRDLIEGIKNGAVVALEGVLQFFKDLPYNIGLAIGTVAGTLFLVGAALIGGLWIGIQSIWNSAIKPFFTDLIPAVVGFIGDTAKTLYGKGKDLLSGLWDGIKEIYEIVKDFFIKLPGRVIEFVADVTKTLYQKGKDLLNGLFDGVKEIGVSVADFFVKLPGNIVQFIGDVAQTLYQKGKDFLSGLLSGINDLVHGRGGVAEFFKDLPGNIVGFVGDVARTLFQKGKDIVQGFKDGVVALYDGAIQLFRDTRQNVIDAVSDAGSWLLEAGKDVVKGLANGIKAVANVPIDAIKSIGRGVVDGFNNVVGNKSPSKVFKQSGVNLMRGLAGGISSSVGMVTKAMDTVAREVLDPLSKKMLPTSIGVKSGSIAAASGSAGNVNSRTTNNYLALNTNRSDTDVKTQFQWMEMMGLGPS